jgi:hypothetical protein
MTKEEINKNKKQRGKRSIVQPEGRYQLRLEQQQPRKIFFSPVGIFITLFLKQPIWLGWIQPIKQLKRKKKNY